MIHLSVRMRCPTPSPPFTPLPNARRRSSMAGRRLSGSQPPALAWKAEPLVLLERAVDFLDRKSVV